MKHLRIALCLFFIGLTLGCSQKTDAQKEQKEHVADKFQSGSIISFHSVAPLCFSKHLLKTLLEHMKNKDEAAVNAMYKKQDCVLVADENIKLNYFKIVSIERPYIEVVGIESKESHRLWSHMLFFKEPGN